MSRKNKCTKLSVAGVFLAMSIAIQPSVANESLPGALESRALIRSAKRIEYRTDIEAPVAEAAYLLGQSFAKGDPLIVMDCAGHQAQLKAAEASARAASIEHGTKKRLLKYQAAGKDEVRLAAAHADRGAAELEIHQVRNRFCRFEAPFAGRVVELYARPHEFPPKDSPLITIIDDRALEMELIVPSTWLVWLKPGTPFEVEVDETGTVGLGQVERIAAEVDPVSQTIKVIAGFEDVPEGALAGMSGAARFWPDALASNTN